MTLISFAGGTMLATSEGRFPSAKNSWSIFDDLGCAGLCRPQSRIPEDEAGRGDLQKSGVVG